MQHLALFEQYGVPALEIHEADVPEEMRGDFIVEKTTDKGVRFTLVLKAFRHPVGTLWLDGDVLVGGKRYRCVKFMGINAPHRKRGLSYLLYKTALRHLDGYAGIASSASEWVNKKAIGSIYRKLGAATVLQPDEDGVVTTYKLLPTTPAG